MGFIIELHKAIVPGPMTLLRNWRLRRLETARARAGQFLAHCQAANENHPGLYTALVREAEADFARKDQQIREARTPKN